MVPRIHPLTYSQYARGSVHTASNLMVELERELSHLAVERVLQSVVVRWPRDATPDVTC
jgi:hypothetical protein